MSNFESLKDFMDSEGYDYYVAGGEETGDEMKENWDELFESKDGINALMGQWDIDEGDIDPPPPQMIEHRMSVIVANPSHRSYLPLSQAFTITPIPVDPIPVDPNPINPIPMLPDMGIRDLGRRGEKKEKVKVIKKKREEGGGQGQSPRREQEPPVHPTYHWTPHQLKEGYRPIPCVGVCSEGQLR